MAVEACSSSEIDEAVCGAGDRVDTDSVWFDYAAQRRQKLDACSTSMIHLMRSVRRERRSATDLELAVGGRCST